MAYVAHNSANIGATILALRGTRDVPLFRTKASNQTTRASANMSDTLQKRGSHHSELVIVLSP